MPTMSQPFGAVADEETDFPEMRDWLDSPPEQVHQADTEHLWGIQNQSSFTMEDIKKWQYNGGTLDKHYNPSPSTEELFTLLHLFLPDSYWTPRILPDWTRTATNFMLADHHTNFVSKS